MWQPGIDHAGIATEMVVERKLILDEKKTKRDIGRNKFLKKFGDGKVYLVTRLLTN